jgi:hypothetical protein
MMHSTHQEKKEAPMTNNGYQHFAEALVFAHGPQAMREAIRHAEFCLKQGDTDMAAHWHATIEEMRSSKNPVPCKVTDFQYAA